MASKENQEALDTLVKNIGLKPDEQTCSYIELFNKNTTLQKAIDDLEIKNKVIELLIAELSKYTYIDINYIDQARKELENDQN